MTYFSGGGAANTLLETPTTSPLSQDVLSTLSSLTVIRLDASLFDDEVFKSLTDYGVDLPTQTAGRRNPFAPL
jgi:hypothetical protein